MYKSVQVEDFDFSIFPEVSSQKVREYKERNENKLIKIQDYLLDRKNTLSVDKISENLFLDIKPDIFLSHSHTDEDDVIAKSPLRATTRDILNFYKSISYNLKKCSLKLQASYIRLAILIEKELNLSVFIDPCVWGDAFKLLRETDEEYCLNGRNFNYQKRNYTTSNVFMILNSALHRVIYNCEAFIFLGTDNSIPINEAFKSERYLSSPWIYYELQFAKLVRRTPSPRQIAMESRDQILAKSLALGSALNFAYPIPETDTILSNKKLKIWIGTSKNPQANHSLHPLDALYKAISHR